MKKVHEGLDEVSREVVYHLGHYEVDFPDGALRFQLHARLCQESDCPCDNIQIDWLSQGRVLQTWFTGEREWRDLQHQPAVEELSHIFQIVEKTETFQERYSHLVFLRRRQVLQEQGRAGDPFQVHLPRQLVSEEGNPQQQILGKVRPGAKGGRALPYAIEFCGDASCYCNHLFVVVMDGDQTTTFCVDSQDKWSPMEASPEASRLQERVAPRLSKHELFQQQLRFFRGERQLHNYHRFVHQYSEQQKV